MSEKLIEALLLMVVGMAGVFASLLLLAAMIFGFRWWDETSNARKIRKYATKLAEEPAQQDELNDELIAVLSAAVESTFGKGVVIRRIALFGKPGSNAWKSHGRQTIMSSHTINQRK